MFLDKTSAPVSPGDTVKKLISDFTTEEKVNYKGSDVCLKPTTQQDKEYILKKYDETESNFEYYQNVCLNELFTSEKTFVNGVVSISNTFNSYIVIYAQYLRSNIAFSTNGQDQFKKLFLDIIIQKRLGILFGFIALGLYSKFGNYRSLYHFVFKRSKYYLLKLENSEYYDTPIFMKTCINLLMELFLIAAGFDSDSLQLFLPIGDYYLTDAEGKKELIFDYAKVIGLSNEEKTEKAFANFKNQVTNNLIQVKGQIIEEIQPLTDLARQIQTTQVQTTQSRPLLQNSRKRSGSVAPMRPLLGNRDDFDNLQLALRGGSQKKSSLLCSPSGIGLSMILMYLMFNFTNSYANKSPNIFQENSNTVFHEVAGAVKSGMQYFSSKVAAISDIDSIAQSNLEAINNYSNKNFGLKLDIVQKVFNKIFKDYFAPLRNVQALENILSKSKLGTDNYANAETNLAAAHAALIPWITQTVQNTGHLASAVTAIMLICFNFGPFSLIKLGTLAETFAFTPWRYAVFVVFTIFSFLAKIISLFCPEYEKFSKMFSSWATNAFLKKEDIKEARDKKAAEDSAKTANSLDILTKIAKDNYETAKKNSETQEKVTEALVELKKAMQKQKAGRLTAFRARHKYRVGSNKKDLKVLKEESEEESEESESDEEVLKSKSKAPRSPSMSKTKVFKASASSSKEKSMVRAVNSESLKEHLMHMANELKEDSSIVSASVSKEPQSTELTLSKHQEDKIIEDFQNAIDEPYKLTGNDKKYLANLESDLRLEIIKRANRRLDEIRSLMKSGFTQNEISTIDYWASSNGCTAEGVVFYFKHKLNFKIDEIYKKFDFAIIQDIFKVNALFDDIHLHEILYLNKIVE